jgi:outer membrane receptor protein involved in Fe transport
VQINTETSESGGTLSSKQIENLMVNGRDFQTMAIAIPGVSSAIAADGQTASQNSILIINGSGVETSTQTIDGVYNVNSGSMAGVNVRPTIEGIEEFTVLKDSYSAKYGIAGSGQVIVETKSGTHTYHGELWDYLRNNAFDAQNYFTTNQALHQNIYGYTLGGPVQIPGLFNKDRSKKTFFFASNQWYKIAAGQASRASVLTDAMRNGDFSNSYTIPTIIDPKTGQPVKALTLDAHSQALLASEGKTNCLLSNTQINPACFDPVAVALNTTYMPQPNDGTGFINYLNQGALITDETDYQYRIDHYINDANLITGRVLYEQNTGKYPYDTWGGSPYNTTTDSEPFSAMNGLFRWQSSITPRLMNTVSLANTFDKLQFLTTSGGTLPAGVTITQAFPDAPTLNRIPNVSISKGWTGFGVSSEPITASDGEGIAQDDVSWVKGNHVFQFGAMYIFGIKHQNVFTNPQGSFSFSGNHTGDPAADYMLGLDSSYSQASNQKLGAYHYRQGEAYAQDDWKITPRLTLNLGLRWQYFSNDTVSGDQVTSFNPNLYVPGDAPAVNVDGTLTVNANNQPLTPDGSVANVLNGLAFAGQSGTPSGFFDPKKTNFGPRVGFAYSLDPKSSLRGGYGIGYSRIPLEQIYNAFGQNPPYNQSANILNSLLSNGTAGTTAAPTTQTLSNAPFSFTPTQIQSYNLTFEHQVLPTMVATLAYAGSQTRHIMSFQGGYDFNFPLPVTAPSIATTGTVSCLAPGQTPSASYDFDPCINTSASSPDYTRPYKGYSTMNNVYDEGTANYNALQSALAYRSGGIQLSVAYTYSKVLTTLGPHGAQATTAQSQGAQNPRDFHAEYGPPSYDFTNDISGTWVLPIPGFQHSNTALKETLGGWAFAGLFLHQSGYALSPGLGTGTNGEASRPNEVKPYQKIGSLGEWFDTSAFQAPEYGFFGDAKNGTIRGPGYTSINVSLYKTFPVYKRLNMQFRAEAFNALNHPNFQNVDTGVGDGAYGTITSAGNARVLEFAMKVLW